MKKPFALPLFAAAVLSLSGWTLSSPVGAARVAAAVDSTILNQYRWRSIGPDRGGRSIAVSGVRGRPNEGYFGATGGGLWKTTDGGANWTPVTDGLITSASVGAVAVSETSPDVVWIGMGETCIRGNIMPGDGVYKSTDAGKSWTHVGFRNVDAIAKIRIHPRNADVVFVAAFGKFGGPSEERGLFKTTDGGRTWRKVLYRDDKTGAVDISIDPNNPDVMYVAMWEAFRTEWTMSSGGPGSSLYKSTDGGETWTEITRNPGLPSGVNGKIAVAVSPADANRVYALIENDNGGLFVSDNAGATWTLANSNRNIRQRAFYYTHLAADPKNKDQIYILNVSAYRSTDGGKTITNLGGGTHGDYHDLWIDPDNAQHMLIANDGGGAVTMTGAAPGPNNAPAWSAQDFPTPQIYRLFATTHQPFHVCGSQQDASSFCISTANPNAFGGGRGGRGGGGGRGGAPAAPLIYNVGGSENGYIAQDPLDPDIFYVGTNANGGGFLNKVNRSTGEEREVSPYPRMFSGEESAVVKERWQWTYPIVYSRLDPRALYVGSQRLWVTRNGGQDWTALSGDLTRHDPRTMGPSGGPITRDMNGPEIYGVIFTIAPSKRDVGVIWTGSDDGLIHVTRNGGQTWRNVTPPAMPDFGRVSIIDASNFSAGTAYAAVKKPLLNDRAPYIFRTRDFGATWTKITNGIRADDYVHVVREDPYQRGVLYAGTQQGVYVSYDDGDSWQSLSLNLPMIPVSDLAVMPNDIAISTHGRGFYVLDNVNPLRRAARASAATGSAYLFAPAPAMRTTPQGATIQYWLKSAAQGVKVEVMDTTGRVIRTFGAGTMAPPVDPNAQGGRGGGRGGAGGAGAPSLAVGLNTINWDLRYPNAVGFPGLIAWGGGLTGPTAPPGRYRVKLTADGYTQTEDLVIVRNPLIAASDADLRAQFNLAIQIRDKVSEANNAVITIRDLKSQIADRLTKSQDAKLKETGDKLTADLSAVESDIYQVKNQAGQDPLNYPIRINNRLMSLMTGVVNSGEGRPVGKVPEIFIDLKAELKVLTDRMDRVISTGVPGFNAAARAAGVEVVAVKRPGPIM